MSPEPSDASGSGRPRSLWALKALSVSIVVVGVALDLWSKAWMARRLDMDPGSAGPFGREELIPGFLALEGTYNTGVTFGLFGGQTDGIMVFTLIATVALLIWLVVTHRASRVLHIGLGMVLGGAIGNLYDRFHWAKVRDFILVYVGDYEWPNFNVADSMIVCGVILILIDELFGHRGRAAAPRPGGGTTGGS